ncbi:MAG: leucine-rich repeat protein [Clostridia bacterium]|nr:leucine-rich repeat protein [Clostridia bacterium]
MLCIGVSAEESASGSFGVESQKVGWGNYFSWSYDAQSKTMRIFDGVDGLETATYWGANTVCNSTGLTMEAWKTKYAPVTAHIEVEAFGKHNSAILYANWTAAKSIHFAKMENLRVDSSSIGLFSGCTNLTKVWSGNGSGTDGVINLSTWRVRNSESPANSFKNLLSGCSSAKKVILPTDSSDTSGIAFTVIDPTTFAGCTSLESIVVGKTVKTVESGSFEGCPNALIDASANTIVAEYMTKNPGIGSPVTGTYAGTSSNVAMDWTLLNGRLTIKVKSNATQIYFNSDPWKNFISSYAKYVKEVYIVLADGINLPYKMMNNESPEWCLWNAFNDMDNCKKVVLPGHICEYAGKVWQDAKSLTTYGPEGTPEGTIDLRGVKKWSYDMTSAFLNIPATTVILPNKATPAKLTGTMKTPFKGSKITNVIIPENVTTIPADFFSGCTITNVTFEGNADNVASILQSMPFTDSENLTFTVYSSAAEAAVRELYPLANIIVGGTFTAGGLTFEGWQVRTRSYNGLRSIMYFNNGTENKGFELLEYGAFVSASANKQGASVSEDGSFNGKGAKVTIYKNGKILANTLSYSNDARTYFALTVVNYTSNWTTDIYVCGYEIWKDTVTGEIKTVYTDYATDPEHDSSFADTNIYEISLGMYQNGIIDALSDPDKVIWNTLVNGGAVKLTADVDYTLDDGADYGADYSGEMLLVNIPLAEVVLNENALSFVNTEANYSVFRDGDGYFMIIGGEGAVPSLPEGCMPQFGTGWYTGMEYESISENRPQPVFKTDIYSNIKGILADNGITAIGERAFADSEANLFILSSTVSEIAENAFAGNDGITIRPAGPDTPILTESLSAYGAWNGLISKDTEERMINESYKMSRLASGSFGLKYNIPCVLEKNTTQVVSFKAYTENTYTTVKVSVIDSAGAVLRSHSYSLSSAASEIFMPMTATGNEASIHFDIGSQLATVHIGDIDVEEFNGTFYNAPTGSYMIKSDEWDDIKIPYASNFGEMTECRDIIVRDGYIYAIGNCNLYIYKANGTSPILVSKQTNIGDLRQMVMTDDGDGLIITARASGVFIYDVSDPENPKMASRIDAAEHATGIDTNGDYCYIADRVFGAGIVNISDIYNPVVTSYISIGECQDVAFYNGYLYCGCWGWCAIEVVDVRDPDNPKHVSECTLSGRGDGIAIADGILYAATGHYFRDHSLGTAGYGLGNGMDIFDLSNPANPKKISVARSDGACYYYAPDLWRVTLSGNYAFLSDCFSGLYVYDITNSTLPKRIAHIDVEAKNGEKGYQNLDKDIDSCYLPFDTSEVYNAPIIDCDMEDGYLYIACYNGGLYIYETELAALPDKNESGIEVTAPEYDLSAWISKEELTALGFKNVKLFESGTQIWEVIEHGGKIYVAAGTDGIYVLDMDMNILNQITSQDITMAIDIGDDGRVYTAESSGGICIYEFDPDDSTNLCLYRQYKVSGASFCDLTVSPGAKFILAQKGSASSLIDIRNLNDIIKVSGYRELTMVYQHQISDRAVDNRYLIVAAATGNPSALIDFGENGSYDTPIVTYWVSGIEQGSGITSDGERFITNANGLLAFDPSVSGVTSSKVTSNSNPAVTRYGIKDGGVPTVCGDYLFVSFRKDGQYSIYKFAAGDHTKAPALVGKYDMKNKAHPSATIVVDKRAYVALGYAGLASFDLEG